MPEKQKKQGTQSISSMLDLASKSVQEKVQKRRQRKEEGDFKKLQDQRAEQAQRGEFAPPLTP